MSKRKDERKASDERITPPDLVSRIDWFFQGRIDADPYSHPYQFLRARWMRTFDTRKESIPHWAKRVFANVPFSQAKFCLRELAAHIRATRGTAVILCPASVGTTYWRSEVWDNPDTQAIGFMKRPKFYAPMPGGGIEQLAGGIRVEVALVLLSGEPRELTVPAFHDAFDQACNYILDLDSKREIADQA